MEHKQLCYRLVEHKVYNVKVAWNTKTNLNDALNTKTNVIKIHMEHKTQRISCVVTISLISMRHHIVVIVVSMLSNASK